MERVERKLWSKRVAYGLVLKYGFASFAKTIPGLTWSSTTEQANILYFRTTVLRNSCTHGHFRTVLHRNALTFTL